MKELSIEQKAKRYDEAIKVAKGNYETIVQMDNDCTFAKEGIVNTFHHIFPELKESKDERIRKDIINLVKKSNKYGGYALHKWEADKMLAWLEKQDEQKPAWSEEDERERKHCIDFLNHPDMIEVTPTVKKGCIDWLKSLKERYTWKPSDEQMDALNLAIGEANSVDTAAGDEAAEILTSLYEQLKKIKGE